MLGGHQTIENRTCQHLPDPPLLSANNGVLEGTEDDSVLWPHRERWLVAIAVLSQLVGMVYVFGWWFRRHGAEPIPVPALGLDSVHLAPVTGWKIATHIWLGALAGIPSLMLLGLLCVWGRRWSLWIALLGILALGTYSGRELFRGILSCQQRRANLQALQAKQTEMLPRARAAQAAVLQRQQEADDAYWALERRVTPDDLFGKKTISRRHELVARRRLLRQTQSACNEVHGQFRHYWKNVDLALVQAQAKDVARLVEDEEWQKKDLSFAARRFFTRFRAAIYALRCKMHEKHLAALDLLISGWEHPRRDPETGEVYLLDTPALVQRYRKLLAQSDELADRLNERKYDPEPGNPDDANVTDEDDQPDVPSPPRKLSQPSRLDKRDRSP